MSGITSCDSFSVSRLSSEAVRSVRAICLLVVLATSLMETSNVAVGQGSFGASILGSVNQAGQAGVNAGAFGAFQTFLAGGGLQGLGGNDAGGDGRRKDGKPLGPVVMTAEGAVMGRREENGMNKPFLAYRGIPYARPPVDDLRFASPQRHPPWRGVKMTMEYQQSCLSYLLRFLVGEEDCLYLNVFVPEGVKPKDTDAGLPVVFWIHGGAFIHGSEFIPVLYHPGTFTDKGFIFVSFNYRLGPLGFLSTDDKELPGNYGLKDMVMALKWVRRNIKRFGGDPNQVNIIGQSAGGVSVHALTLSPSTKGLFSSAISMSGSIFTLWGHNPTGRPMARHLASSLDCPVDNSRRMLACLRQRGAKEITSAIQEFFTLGIRYGTPFAPVVDWYAEDPFFPEHPLNLIKNKKFSQVPYVFGSVPREMNLFLPGVIYEPKSYEKLTTDWDNECGRVAYNFLYFSEVNPSQVETSALCKKARSLYLPQGSIDPDGTASDIAKFGSDIYFSSATYAAALLHARHSSAPVYYYSWEHENQGALGILNFLNNLADNKLQMLFTNATRIRPARLHSTGSHSDDITLLFSPPKLNKLTKDDMKVRNFITTMFTSFWNTKQPTASGVPWPRFEPQTQKYVGFSMRPHIKSFLISQERLELFANWYDVAEKKFRGSRPSLATMLGFKTTSTGRDTVDNELRRFNRAQGSTHGVANGPSLDGFPRFPNEFVPNGLNLPFNHGQW